MTNSPAESSAIGRVVRLDAKQAHVALGAQIVPCVPRGRLFEDLAGRKNPMAVGDLVRVEREGDAAGIAEVLPRRNYLSRVASMHDPREQILFANVDQLLVIASVRNPLFSSMRVDRILSACSWHGIPAMLVLNKIDLDKKRGSAKLEETYRLAGYRVLLTSTKTGSGLGDLRDLLLGKVSALYGGSGVGKSSLLNAIQPSLGLAEGRISAYWDSGQHTTSFSRWIELEGLGSVIDTPGVRSFRAHGMHADDLRGAFPEFAAPAALCRFPDCSHDHEPGCAVREALDKGQIAASRYASYVELLDEVSQTRTSQAESSGSETEPES